ncbi:hypothetical protein [Streptomyces thermoalcalitolerans]|uniref:Uncharacterized protein n=1 Tax=Streptomyces thermoalcalitolerans TaxID=65605 RepID=A0ABP3YYX6_9ACTN
MITVNSVGDWFWEVATEPGEASPMRAAETAVAVWNVLAAHELAVPVGKVSVSARIDGEKRDYRINVSRLSLEPEPLARDTELSRVVAEAETLEGDFIFTVRIDCPGLWLESGVKHRAEKLFSIHTASWEGGLLTLLLETYSDAWLTMDTRDREQLEIHAANSPRLAAALREISDLMGSAPTPGGLNRFATSTETGFEDSRVEEPAYEDSWGTFEPRARLSLLYSRLPDSEDEYEVVTDHPVRYFTIRREGQTLGYLWASTGDEAAGYEPRTAAGDDAFDAGAQWVLRLRAAHEQGLTALAALDWATRQPPQPEIGEAAEDTPQEAPSLDALQEMSSRY